MAGRIPGRRNKYPNPRPATIAGMPFHDPQPGAWASPKIAELAMRNAQEATSVSFDESRRTVPPTRYRHAPAMYRPAAPGPPATPWRFTSRIRKATDPIAIGRPINRRRNANSSYTPAFASSKSQNHAVCGVGLTGDDGLMPAASTREKNTTWKNVTAIQTLPQVIQALRLLSRVPIASSGARNPGQIYRRSRMR